MKRYLPDCTRKTAAPSSIRKYCTPAEALAGVTRHAARALGMSDRGTLSVGKRADIVLWDIDTPAEIAYRLGGNMCAAVIRGGVVQKQNF